MMKNFVKVLILYLSLVIPGAYLSASSFVFKLVEEWKHGDQTFGPIISGIIDKDQELIIRFFDSGPQYITSKGVSHISQLGQGPDDVEFLFTVFEYKGDMGFVERADKVKIFRKIAGKYRGKEFLWWQRGPYPHFISKVIFTDNKFFLAGMGVANFSDGIQKYYYVRVLDNQGKIVKTLLNEDSEIKKIDYRYLSYFILDDQLRKRVLYLREDRLDIHPISTSNLKEDKVIHLENPVFYKPMPEDFYFLDKKKDAMEKIMLYLEEWKYGYSAISTALIYKNYLVLQIRTCDQKMKHFALLFYNLDSFKLEQTIMSNDFLLCAGASKFYFYANGSPGMDENTDLCTIKICELENKQ